MSYIFGGSSTPQTYDDVQERRRIARQLLAANARTPQTFGDGLASVGRAIAARRNMNQAEKGGAILQGEFDAQMQALMGGMSGAPVGGGGATPSSRSYAPSGVSAEAPPNGSFGRIPSTDPDANDPRRSQFATAAPRANEDAAPVSTGPLQIFPETRATHSPGSGLNISMDFNASPNGGARGTEVIIPNNASPELRAAAEEYNRGVAEWAAANGIENYPVRGVRTVAENGRGVGNTVHTEPFFNDDLEMQRAIEADPHGFAGIYANAFGGVDGRLIAPHGVGSDRGAASPVFGDETSYGERMAQALLGQGVRTPIPGDQSAPAVTMSAQNAPAMPQGAPQAMPQGGMPTAATDPKLAEYAQSMQIGGDPMSRLAAMGNLMGNEMASPGQQMVLQALMQQEMGRMQPPDPMDALRQRQMELEIAQMEQDIAGGGPIDPFGPDVGVRSSEILPNGVTIQSTDYGVRVFGADGQPLEGEAAQAAIAEAQQYGVDLQRDIYGNRRAGTLESDIALGGQAASAEAAGSALGTASVDAGVEAWGQSQALLSTIGTYDEAIAAIDNGAEAGLVYNRLPRVSLEGATLQNAMNRLGLDVVGATTFGALSEGELRLAMETAVPRGLGGPELREWLSRRRVALERSAAMLENAAAYLTTPGNDLNGWIEQNRQQQNAAPTNGGQSSTPVQAPEPPAAQAAPAASNDPPPSWGSLPEGTRAELMRRHTPEELAEFFEDFQP